MVVDLRPKPATPPSRFEGMVEFICFDGSRFTVDVDGFLSIKRHFLYFDATYDIIGLIKVLRMVRGVDGFPLLGLKNARDIVEVLIGERSY